MVNIAKCCLSFLVYPGWSPGGKGNESDPTDASADTLPTHHRCCTNSRCRTWLSIRSGSFFEGSNIPLSTWLHLMFLWAIKASGSNIARLTSLSKPTVIRALSDLRTVCSTKIMNADMKIGGVGKTVEIDESKFGAKRKYQRGRVFL